MPLISTGRQRLSVGNVVTFMVAEPKSIYGFLLGSCPRPAMYFGKSAAAFFHTAVTCSMLGTAVLCASSTTSSNLSLKGFTARYMLETLFPFLFVRSSDQACIQFPAITKLKK